MKLHPCQFSGILLLLMFFVSSCSDSSRAEKQEASWDQLKSDAKSTYADVVELSKEKWDEIKSFSSEEWQEAGRSIVELKDKAVETGKQTQPKVKKMLEEVDGLRKEASEQLKELQSATGEKAEASKRKLDETWKKLQEKMDAVREAVGEGG